MDLPNATSTVEYGLSEESLVYSTPGSSSEFVDGGAEQRRQFIHRATLTDLKPGRKYRKNIFIQFKIIKFNQICFYEFQIITVEVIWVGPVCTISLALNQLLIGHLV